jgi:hypothetical protein
VIAKAHHLIANLYANARKHAKQAPALSKRRDGTRFVCWQRPKPVDNHQSPESPASLRKEIFFTLAKPPHCRTQWAPL